MSLHEPASKPSVLHEVLVRDDAEFVAAKCLFQNVEDLKLGALVHVTAEDLKFVKKRCELKATPVSIIAAHLGGCRGGC